MTQKGIDLTLRGIHEFRKRLPTKGGEATRAILDKMEGRLSAAKVNLQSKQEDKDKFSTAAPELEPGKLEETLDDPKKMGQIKTFPKGELGGGPTGWAFELGSKVKTAAELDQFKEAYRKYSDQAAALKNKYDTDKAANGKGNIADIMAMQEVGLKGQLAHEAYQAATGERLDGKPGTSTDFIRQRYKADYSPPMAGKDFQTASPRMREEEKSIARTMLEGAAEMKGDLGKVLRPPSVSITAETTAGTMREKLAELARKDVVAQKQRPIFSVADYRSHDAT